MSLDDQWDQSGLVGKLAAGRYLIGCELSNDNRRTLFEAEAVELGVPVMLCVIRPDGKPVEERLAKGEKLTALRHAGLFSVLDVGKLATGEVYVATERPEGTTLRAAAVERIEQRRAVMIMRQVLDALAAVHALGAIHGDVKPETIVLAPGLGEDRVKLSNLGVAMLRGGPGDPVYGGPESALGGIDARTDLYAVGAVLFELLTGHAPFFADDAAAVRRLHAYAPVQTLKQRAPDRSFPEALETVVAMALAKKREARFQSASDMLAALDAALDAIEAASPPLPAKGAGPAPNDSLLLLAKDLMPVTASLEQAAFAPVVPVNVDRKVPQLAWSTRLQLAIRRRLAKLDRRQKQIVGSVVAAALALGLVVAVVTCTGSGTKPQRTSDAKPKPAPPATVAQRAQTLVEQGKGRDAIKLLEREIAAHPDDVRARLALGDTHLALKHDREALSAYENAVAMKRAVAKEPAVLANLDRLASSKDATTAMAALDLIALLGGSSGATLITKHASTNPHAKVRQYAYELAERAGNETKVDRVTRWSLDLDQATTCEERGLVISKLVKAADKRALPALQRAKAHKCTEAEATAAIEHIEH